MNRREFMSIAVAGVACHGLAARASVARTTPVRVAARRKAASLAAGRVSYVRHGRGQSALLIHAWPLNAFQWRGAVALLSRDFDCIAPDMLGLGASEAAASEITPHTQVEMLVQLLDHLRISSVHLVGNDSGGAVAQLFAAYHPERTRSLLLTNCDVGSDNPPESFQPIVRAARAGVLVDRFIRPQLADLSVARSMRGLGLAYSDPAFLTAEAVRTYLAPLVSSDVRTNQFHRYTVSLGENVLAAAAPRLAGLRAPSRVVWGSADTFFSQSDPDYLARLLPHFRGTRRVPGAKLYFPEEMPQLVAEEARSLWSSVDARSG